MKQFRSSAVYAQEGRPVRTQPPTRLPGRFLWPVRIAWLLLLVLIVTLLVVNAPTNVIYARNEYMVEQAREAILAFTSLQTFAEWLVTIRWLVVAVYFATAFLIAWRRWDDSFALLVSAALLLLAWGFVMRGDRNTWLYPPLLLPIASAITFVMGQLPILGLLLMFFLFPDGRFVFKWHKWLALLTILATALFSHADEYPLLWRDYRPLLERWAWPIWSVLLLGSLLIALAGQIYRYRRLATPEQRQQMKWVLFGLAGILAIPLLSWPLEDAGGPWGTLAAIGVALAAVTFLPLTIGFSILRYRLWQVDLFINRALVFGGLTLLVTTVYVLVVGVLGVLFREGRNVALSILATGLIAVLFHPLRQRLQQGVNRLMYGERDDPVMVLSRLGERLEKTTVPGDTLPALVETIAQTLKLPYVAITVEDDVVAVSGTANDRPLHRYPLIYQSQAIGELVVSARADGEAFTGSDERLLRNVARQAGPAVYAERLTNQLQRSRERLVTTREEERRRLRRDLHDGLGPRLATLTLKASAAKNLLKTDPDAAEALLDEVKGESQSAIKEIRRVVDGLRPSALDQLGLVSALQEFAEQDGNGRTQVTLLAPDRLPALPAAVEVAAYRIVTEAVTNAVRHAHAKVCIIRLEMNEALCLEIRDDGDGLPVDYQPGVGLTSMRERAIELGGRFKIESNPGNGTVLTVQLPLKRSE